MQKTKIGEYLSIPQAAKYVKMSVQLFRHYCKTDRVPNPFEFCGRVYYHPDDLKGWKPDKKEPGRKKKYS